MASRIIHPNLFAYISLTPDERNRVGGISEFDITRRVLKTREGYVWLMSNNPKYAKILDPCIGSFEKTREIIARDVDLMRYHLNEPELYLIDARGDGHCFENCIFIYMWTFGIFDGTTPSDVKRIDELMPFAMFDSLIIDIAKSIIRKECHESSSFLIERLTDPNVPDITFIMKAISVTFNIGICVINYDKELISITYSNKSDSATGYIVIIGSGVHFKLLTIRIAENDTVITSINVKYHRIFFNDIISTFTELSKYNKNMSIQSVDDIIDIYKS